MIQSKKQEKQETGHFYKMAETTVKLSGDDVKFAEGPGSGGYAAGPGAMAKVAEEETVYGK